MNIFFLNYILHKIVKNILNRRFHIGKMLFRQGILDNGFEESILEN